MSRANRTRKHDRDMYFLRGPLQKSSSKHKPRTPVANYSSTTTQSLPVVVRQAITALRNNLLIGPSWGFSRPPLVISSGIALPPQAQTPPPRLGRARAVDTLHILPQRNTLYGRVGHLRSADRALVRLKDTFLDQVIRFWPVL